MLRIDEKCEKHCTLQGYHGSRKRLEHYRIRTFISRIMKASCMLGVQFAFAAATVGQAKYNMRT